MSARGLCPRLGGCGRAPRGLLYEPAARPLPLPRDRRQRRWRMEPGGRLAVLRSAPPFLPDRLVSRRVGGALPAGGPRRTEALHAAVARARRRIGADGRRTHAGSANAKELPAAGHRYDLLQEALLRLQI